MTKKLITQHWDWNKSKYLNLFNAGLPIVLYRTFLPNSVSIPKKERDYPYMEKETAWTLSDKVRVSCCLKFLTRRRRVTSVFLTEVTYFCALFLTVLTLKSGETTIIRLSLWIVQERSFGYNGEKRRGKATIRFMSGGAR